MSARLACCLALSHILWCGHARAQTHTASQAYRTTAKQDTVLQSALVSVPGKEGTVLRVELPAGWIGDWHYHTGDVFVYVVSGEFVVDVERQGRQRFGPGQVYHEAVKTTMQARNPSATEQTELILFQVGAKGEPLMFRAAAGPLSPARRGGGCNDYRHGSHRTYWRPDHGAPARRG